MATIGIDRRQGRGACAYARIHATVRRIPRGRVATYGQVAALAGLPGHARQVGYALAALDGESTVPWHRVVDGSGRVKPRATPGADALQRARLLGEGVSFDAADRIALARFGWKPRGPASVERRTDDRSFGGRA